MTPAQLAAKTATQPAAAPVAPAPDPATCKDYEAFCAGNQDCCIAYDTAQKLKEDKKPESKIRDQYEAAATALTNRKQGVPAGLHIQRARSWLKNPSYKTVIDLLGSVRGWPTPKNVEQPLLENLQADLAAKAKNLSQETPSAQVQRGLLLVIQVLTQGKSDADKKQALAPALALCTQVAASLNGSKPKDRDDLVLKWHKVLKEQVKSCPAIVSGQQAAGLSAAVPVATNQPPGKATRSPGLGNPQWPLMPSAAAAKAASGQVLENEKDKQSPPATPVAAALSLTPRTAAGIRADLPVATAAASPAPMSPVPARAAPADPGRLPSDAAESQPPAQASVALIATPGDKAPRVPPPSKGARWKVAVVSIAGACALGLGVGLGVGLGAPGQYLRAMSLSVQP
jgi:hypothetical protein